MSLKINAPVSLSKDNEGYWLTVETESGQTAAISLNENGPLVKRIFNKWADEQFTAAMLQRRRRTGLKDVTGTLVLEGDIVERFDFTEHTEVFGVVKWDGELAAFVMQGIWPSGQYWQTSNLKDVQAAKIVGNVFQNSDLLKPAKKIT